MADDGAATLTIGVYRVNRETGERTVIKPTQVVGAGSPLMTSEFPPCSCFLCTRAR